MLKVYVKLDEVWNYFQCKKEHFKDAMDSIAEVLDNETERPLVRIYLTEENGYPLMTVEQVCENDGEEVIEKECAISLNDCTSVYRKMLTMLEEYDTDLEQVSEADETDIIIVEEREAELKEVLACFINSLMGYDGDENTLSSIIDGEELDEILDYIEGMMFEFGFIIYRPRIAEKDGKQIVVDSMYCEE